MISGTGALVEWEFWSPIGNFCFWYRWLLLFIVNLEDCLSKSEVLYAREQNVLSWLLFLLYIIILLLYTQLYFSYSEVITKNLDLTLFFIKKLLCLILLIKTSWSTTSMKLKTIISVLERCKSRSNKFLNLLMSLSIL